MVSSELEKIFFSLLFSAICLFGLMACAHSGVTPTGEETKGVPADKRNPVRFCRFGKLMPVISPQEKKVLVFEEF